MSNEIRSIASVRGLFGRECVHLYHEADLMKPVGKDMFGDTWYTIEEFEVQSDVMGRYAVGLCVNSYPFFCRYDLCEYGDGTPRQSWLENLNKSNSVHEQMKDVAKYEGVCPKCGWGVSAYLAIRCRRDAKWGVRYYDRQGNETNQRTTFEAYLNICRTIYKAIHQDEYTHYKAIGDVEALNRLEADFISQHRKAEEQNRNISGEVDRLFFGGQLAKVVGEYLDYVSGVEAGGHQEGQQADKWVIPTDCLIVFGNRENAAAFLDSVVGRHYNITMYGKSMKAYAKAHGITRQQGFGKKVWLLICANDKDMKPESQETFTRAW
jgi:hypothetical protein